MAVRLGGSAWLGTAALWLGQLGNRQRAACRSAPATPAWIAAGDARASRAPRVMSVARWWLLPPQRSRGVWIRRARLCVWLRVSLFRPRAAPLLLPPPVARQRRDAASVLARETRARRLLLPLRSSPRPTAAARAQQARVRVLARHGARLPRHARPPRCLLFSLVPGCVCVPRRGLSSTSVVHPRFIHVYPRASTYIRAYPRVSTCIHGKSTLLLVNPRIGISGVSPLSRHVPKRTIIHLTTVP